MSLPTIELAYLAGFFDGEGCIHVSKCKRSDRKNDRFQYQLRIQISQKNREPLDKLVAGWGGGIYDIKSKGMYSWQLHSRKAERFLEAILPFLRDKAEQAELALIFQANRGKSTAERDEQLYLLLKGLKK